MSIFKRQRAEPPIVHAAAPTGHRYEHIERGGDLVAVVCTRCGAHWEVEE